MMITAVRSSGFSSQYFWFIFIVLVITSSHKQIFLSEFSSCLCFLLSLFGSLSSHFSVFSSSLQTVRLCHRFPFLLILYLLSAFYSTHVTQIYKFFRCCYFWFSKSILFTAPVSRLSIYKTIF